MLAVPSPRVIIDVLPHVVYINKPLSLSCIVAVDFSVDTPAIGYIIWYKDNSTIIDHRETISSSAFNSTFTISSLSIAENGTSFTCSAMIRNSVGAFFLITDSQSEETEVIINAECRCKIWYIILC